MTPRSIIPTSSSTVASALAIACVVLLVLTTLPGQCVLAPRRASLALSSSGALQLLSDVRLPDLLEESRYRDAVLRCFDFNIGGTLNRHAYPEHCVAALV